MLNPDRFFDPDATTRDIARRLYAEGERPAPASVPTVTSIRRFSPKTRPFPDPTELIIIPITTSFGCSTRAEYRSRAWVFRLGTELCRDRSPPDLADFCRKLLPVPRELRQHAGSVTSSPKYFGSTRPLMVETRWRSTTRFQPGSPRRNSSPGRFLNVSTSRFLSRRTAQTTVWSITGRSASPAGEVESSPRFAPTLA